MGRTTFDGQAGAGWRACWAGWLIPAMAVAQAWQTSSANGSRGTSATGVSLSSSSPAGKVVRGLG